MGINAQHLMMGWAPSVARPTTRCWHLFLKPRDVFRARLSWFSATMPDRRSIINYISSPFERGISCKASSKRCGAISSEMSPDFLTLPDLQVLSGPLCMACQTRSSDGATAVRSPPTFVSCPYGLWRPSAGGGGSLWYKNVWTTKWPPCYNC